MAFLLGCEKISLEFPTKKVFDKVSVGLSDGCRIGIVGQNGDGKSTLLRLLAGDLLPDEGRVIRTRGVSVGMLFQNDAFDDKETVSHVLFGDTPAYELMGSARIRELIDALIGDVSFDAKVGKLSGGQRRRLDLARLLAGDWDILLLDEPTNHLDMKTIAWLANHLKTVFKQGQGALAVVTHDRWFLDEVCMGMWEVYGGGVETFEGGFSAYTMQRVERARLAAVAEEKRRNLLRRELAWLSRGARARATKPKFHVEAARALIADVPELRNTLELKRMAMARIGKQVIDCEGISLDLDGKRIVSDMNFSVRPGDRIGILGENGAGKTTLLKLLQGKIIPNHGLVKIGKTVRFAYLSQNLEELSAYGNARVYTVIGRYGGRGMLDGKEQTPAQLLERLGFTNADLNDPVCDLSGGQKRRLALMLILLDQPNVLILDEPGNDLDVDMLAAMEDLLDGWPGSLIIVTHDRYLMERVSDNQYLLENGVLRHLPGGLDQYMKEAFSSKDFEKPLKEAPVSVSSESELGEKEKRELRKSMLSLEKQISTLKKKRETLKDAMMEMPATDYVSLGKQQSDIDEITARIDSLENQWLETAERLGM
ncbi:MAG: ABC-F family ATP-binding cassette domain-containing protein [Eggerthellaceae bacterium]|nr:ABC-F family ATP-binding cassette domain-containing protein [Eggerthellaceae bacterium]